MGEDSVLLAMAIGFAACVAAAMLVMALCSEHAAHASAKSSAYRLTPSRAIWAEQKPLASKLLSLCCRCLLWLDPKIVIGHRDVQDSVGLLPIQLSPAGCANTKHETENGINYKACIAGKAAGTAVVKSRSISVACTLDSRIAHGLLAVAQQSTDQVYRAATLVRTHVNRVTRVA